MQFGKQPLQCNLKGLAQESEKNGKGRNSDNHVLLGFLGLQNPVPNIIYPNVSALLGTQCQEGHGTKKQ
jgi:hypothetical protein